MTGRAKEVSAAGTDVVDLITCVALEDVQSATLKEESDGETNHKHAAS